MKFFWPKKKTVIRLDAGSGWLSRCLQWWEKGSSSRARRSVQHGERGRVGWSIACREEKPHQPVVREQRMGFHTCRSELLLVTPEKSVQSIWHVALMIQHDSFMLLLKQIGEWHSTQLYPTLFIRMFWFFLPFLRLEYRWNIFFFFFFFHPLNNNE